MKMFRITKTFENETTTIYKIEGRVLEDLIEEWNQELENLIPQNGHQVILDFSQVWFLCQKGIEALFRENLRRFYLMNCSMDIRNTLHAAGFAPRILG